MTLRGVAAAFDAIAMVALALVTTGGAPVDRDALVVVWGSAAAAVVAALVVLTGGPPALGWAAVGYMAFAGLLASDSFVPLVLLLAVAYMPILQRPRGSVSLGIAVAALVAIALGVAIRVL